MDDNVLNWLAGLLEGEGSFMKGTPCQPRMPIISLQMTDEDVVAKVSQLFGVKYYSVPPKKEHHKTVFSMRLRGYHAVEIMKKLNPLMSNRRQSQIKNALSCYSAQYRCLSKQQVIEIRSMLEAGLGQSEVARRFNVSRTAIHKIHRNKSHTRSI